MVNVRKRGKVFQYQFEIAPVDGVRKYINKSGFKTKAEAEKAGIIAYNEYTQTGHNFMPNTMSYSDYLDYWLKEHCQINLKYHTIQAYSNIIKNHIKPRLGFYRLSQITTATLQEFLNNLYVEKAFSKNFMKNILKVLKTSFAYATDVVGFVKENPAIKVKIPRYDVPEEDPAHIFSKEEIQMILERFENNHAFYYAILTAYYTGLRVSEAFGLTWNDIDLENKTLTVNKNILKKNQNGATHGRHISGKATTVWYFGTCKTQGSYRTIEIGDTLVNALKEYKAEQEKDKEEIFSDTFFILWKNRNRLNINVSLNSYLAGITRNLIKEKYRKLKIVYDISDFENDILNSVNMYESDRELIFDVEQKMKELKDIDIEIVNLFYYSSMSVKDIAKKLNISELNVKTRLHRIRKKIKKELNSGGI